ncbi:MAG: TIR domain-containing protein [Hyphomicrobiaceae bacterium]
MRQDDHAVAVTASPPATSNVKESDTKRAASQSDSKQPDGKLKVFISYSRKDTGFANELLTGLEIAGFEAFLDTHDILPGEPWEDRLGRLIATADTVVFAISPNSVASAHCEWEINRTEQLAKRLLPIVWQPVEDAKVPARLKRLNYVFFDKPHSFAPALAALAQALRTDLNWVREHTRLLTRAHEWEAAGKAENRLLSGNDIVAAKTWLAKTGAAQHLQPTELHRDFIQASEQAEALRLSAERQRVGELQTAVKRTRLALAATALFLVMALGAAGSAYLSQRVARQQTAVAEGARAEAEQAKTKLTVKLAELQRSEKALSTYITKTAPKVSDGEIMARLGEGAMNLIIQSEVGSAAEYERRFKTPSVPGGSSGITVGIGYDVGYHTPDEVAQDWAELPAADLALLKTASGLRGPAAVAHLPQVANVVIPYDMALRQLRGKTIVQFGRKTLQTFPGALDLPPDAFGALVSLVYNRGHSITGDRRDEMRAIRSLLILGDYPGVAGQIRGMKRLWPDVIGLVNRREAEATLFETSVTQAVKAAKPAKPAAAPASAAPSK